MSKTPAPKHSDSEIDSILSLAHAAGLVAANACTPIPMTVAQHANPFSDASPVLQSYHVPSGVCGFAWVNVKPGTSRLAKRMLATGVGRKDGYYGGVTRWVSEFGQSMQKKEAFATAFARVLEQHGYPAHMMSRMD